MKEIETLALFRLLLIKLLLLQLRKKMGRSGISRMAKRLHLPQHFFYSFPLPQGEGSFLPILDPFSSPLYISGFNTLTILSDIGIICGNIFLPLKQGLNSSLRASKSLLRSNSRLFSSFRTMNSAFWGYLNYRCLTPIFCSGHRPPLGIRGRGKAHAEVSRTTASRVQPSCGVLLPRELHHLLS